jgi:ferrochelatase
VRRLAVLCPAFVADCLETLEEVGLRLRDDFLARGGEALTLVPSLNAADAWADAVVAIAAESTGLGAALREGVAPGPLPAAPAVR